MRARHFDAGHPQQVSVALCGLVCLVLGACRHGL